VHLKALTGPHGADLAVALAADPASGCPLPHTLKKIQLKTFAPDGTVATTRNLTDVPDTNFELGDLPRNRRVEADLLVKTDASERTFVVRGSTRTLLRPDLVVDVHAPAQTLPTREFDVVVDVSERNGDVDADALVSLSAGAGPVAAPIQVTVPAGKTVPVTFRGITLSEPVSSELKVVVSQVSPTQTDDTNDDDSTTVDVTKLELAPFRVLLDGLGGFGAQFNQHVYAPMTGLQPATAAELEPKVVALAPQLARIWFNRAQEADSANMESFVKTVELADEAGADIIISYQSAAIPVKTNPALYMGRFAAVLQDLVVTRGLNVRWVTIQNEINRTLVTPPEFEALYRALDAELVARGLRKQIGLMGGDLVEFSDVPNVPNPDQRTWFTYMAEHMNDVLDAYSVHIYWNYWDIPRMEFRLKDVRHIVTEELPEAARKPVYITEFGVRGIVNLAGFPSPAPQPGYWSDGTPLARTNIAAFQQLWFNLLSAQLGFAGAVKWDAYWGVYDGSYRQTHFLIGPAGEDWPLFPSYFSLQLLFRTTGLGWRALAVEPWTDDLTPGRVDAREQKVVAFAGLDDELTIAGLDTNGRGLNAVSDVASSYSIGRLTPGEEFTLVVWNADGAGENSTAATLTANAAGVVRFDVPLHAAFALTTVRVS